MPQPTALIPCQASFIRLLAALVVVTVVHPVHAQDDQQKAREAALELQQKMEAALTTINH